MSLAAFDRQIKPIYDALDTGSNKAAIVSCTKLLKKHPKNDLLKALKALALVRSQKVEESLVLCDEVLESKPTQDSVLTAMMHVLRGLGRHKDMVTMYEEAYKQQPMNEELGAQTFFANVRANQWKSAQQVATKMHKQFQDDRYLYWSALSAVLQAGDPATPTNMQELLHKLAHRIITSSPNPSYQSADRFYLHLSILRLLGLLDEAHKLLDGDVGKAICATSLSVNELRRDIWRLRGMTKEEGVLSETRILEHKDRNWLEFLSVLNATFSHLECGEPSDESRAACKEHISASKILFSNVAEEDGVKDRSGLLALLELEKRSWQHEVFDDRGHLIALMRKYFDTFGSKSCCFEDLKPYLQLDGVDYLQWRSYLETVSASPTTPGELIQLINSYKLLRHTLSESDVTTEAEFARVNLYVQHYLKGLKLGKDLPPTELQHADDLALLAANALINLWRLSSENKYLIDVVVLLEYAIAQSKQSFQARLILIRVYRLLGAPSLALDHYRALGVKQIQNDTLSHLVLSRGSTFSLASIGDLTLATECIESTHIYLSNSQETSDFIVRAFTAEKYSQIPEFIKFEDRLDNSLQRNIIKLEHLRMRLTHEPVSSDVIDMELIELKFIFDRSHYDNRDFGIFPNYQPAITESIMEQTQLFGKNESLGWTNTFLKLYIRAFQQASDLDDTVEEKLLIGDRPRQSNDPNKKLPLKERLVQDSAGDLDELTSDEVLFVQYAKSLADWLQPYHDYTRPPPSVVLAEAAKQTELKTGHPLKGVDLQALDAASQGNGKKDEEPPVVTEPPEIVVNHFDGLRSRFAEMDRSSSPVLVLHVATLAQEAFLLFIVETFRFKSSSVVKIHKLGTLVASFKALRTNALEALKEIAGALLDQSDRENSSESRKALLDGLSVSAENEISQEFVLNMVKKVSEARKKVLEGVSKGMMKLCATYSS